MAVYAALLRGVNLLGYRRVPMKELEAIFVKAGCGQVKTYIQSGNVVFQAPAAGCDGLPEKLSGLIEKRLGHRPEVLLRSLAEMRSVVKGNPYLKAGVDEKTLAVMFLANKPKKSEVEALDPKRSPGDEYTVRGAEIYLKLGAGFANTKLTNAYFDSKLKTISTARNWRTTVTLLAMLEEMK